MKISQDESGRAMTGAATQGRILPESRAGLMRSAATEGKRQLSPLEKGMVVAKTALLDVPDVREDVVNEIKARLDNGEYHVSGSEIADMMLRRLAADRLR